MRRPRRARVARRRAGVARRVRRRRPMATSTTAREADTQAGTTDAGPIATNVDGGSDVDSGRVAGQHAITFSTRSSLLGAGVSTVPSAVDEAEADTEDADPGPIPTDVDGNGDVQSDRVATQDTVTTGT